MKIRALALIKRRLVPEAGASRAESGIVSVFTGRNRQLVHEGDITVPHAHTVSVDPRTHLVYLTLQVVDGYPVLRIMTGRRFAH